MTGKISQSVLVVEDSDEDFSALARVMKKCSVINPIYRCIDGDEALDFLYHQGEYDNPEVVPRPSIILLDLNLPGTDGREVIDQVKQDDDLKTIPIVVLTTSSNPKDIKTCYQFGVNAYMQKPIGIEKLQKTIETFVENWLEVTILPDSSLT